MERRDSTTQRCTSPLVTMRIASTDMSTRIRYYTDTSELTIFVFNLMGGVSRIFLRLSTSTGSNTVTISHEMHRAESYRQIVGRLRQLCRSKEREGVHPLDTYRASIFMCSRGSLVVTTDSSPDPFTCMKKIISGLRARLTGEGWWSRMKFEMETTTLCFYLWVTSLTNSGTGRSTQHND